MSSEPEYVEQSQAEMLSRIELLRNSLLSDNPFMRNISFTNENLLFLDIVSRISNTSSIVEGYNTTIEYIRNFCEGQSVELGVGVLSSIEIKVKIKENKSFDYYNKSKYPPHKFLKNKALRQTIVIVGKKGSEMIEIISIPFMVGSKWCITYEKTPQELHAMGENTIDYKGYFIINGTAHYFLAHEKIAHNQFITTKDDETGSIVTSLKIQDSQNNSVESRVFKTNNIYFLKTTCLKENLDANKVLNQMFLLIKHMAFDDESIYVENTYREFIGNLIEVVAGDLKRFVMYNFVLDNQNPIPIPDKSFHNAVEELFVSPKRATIHRNKNKDLTDVAHFPELVIASIFPSIDIDNDTKAQKISTIRSKSFVLMRMIVMHLLTSQGVIEPVDRNNVANMLFLTPGEVIRRDLTRDNGNELKNRKNKVYKPKETASSGDNDVFETLSLANFAETLSQLTTLSTPRSRYSRNFKIRGVNQSHTGTICLFETPTSGKIGLTKHLACTACFTTTKNIEQLMKVVERYVKKGNFHMSKNKKLLSINSIPFTLVDEEEMFNLRRKLKRNPTYRDLAITEETYMIHGKRYISNYNISADSGRVYRPIYDSDVLFQKGLIEDGEIEKYISMNSYERLLEEGIIITCFPSEMEVDMIAETRKSLKEKLDKYKEYFDTLRLGKINDELYEKLKREGLTEKNKELLNEMKYSKEVLKRIDNNVLLLKTLEGEFFISDLELAKTLRELDIPRYCEINPIALYGIVGSIMPFGNKCPGPRVIHEAAMTKSALTGGSTNSQNLIETSQKIIYTTEQAAVTSLTNELFSMHMKNGINVIMGILIKEGNDEDAFCASGKFAKTLFTERISTVEIEFVSKETKAGRPPTEQTNASKYHAIQDDGLPIIGSYLSVGDCVFGMYSEKETIASEENIRIDKNLTDGKNTTIEYKNESRFIKVGEEGIVDKIKKINFANSTTFRIIIANAKTLDTGDKLGLRCSQKGVIGKMIPYRELPYVIDDVDENGNPIKSKNRGLRPDCIFSPMSVSSRGTPAIAEEMHLGNYAIMMKKAYDATTFKTNLKTIAEASVALEMGGFRQDSVEKFYDPTNGQTFRMMIGTSHIRILKHTSYDKQKASGPINHPVDKMIRQPTKGGPEGAIKEGFMEMNTIMAHASSNLLHSLYSSQSDQVFIYLCNNCGHYNDRFNPAEEPSSKFCAKCESDAIIRTKSTYGAVMIHNQLAAAGIKMSMWPSI